ncbi:hypothetical protein HMPREF1861_02402 [Corynebacterium kroppenstedtii]|nr:hypothetical protein HMPREF1861_02402 [Corynebacterium kroppenstedtii]
MQYCSGCLRQVVNLPECGNVAILFCDIASGRRDSHLVSALIACGGVQLPPAVQCSCRPGFG